MGCFSRCTRQRRGQPPRPLFAFEDSWLREAISRAVCSPVHSVCSPARSECFLARAVYCRADAPQAGQAVRSDQRVARSAAAARAGLLD